MKINLLHRIGASFLVWTISLFTAKADGHRFGYTYEPETPPKGELELENWVTLRTQRDKTVGQDDYNLWEFRQELEYGVTDDYAVGLTLYLEPRFSGNAAEIEEKLILGQHHGSSQLDLEGHERVNIRLMFGFEF